MRAGIFCFTHSLLELFSCISVAEPRTTLKSVQTDVRVAKCKNHVCFELVSKTQSEHHDIKNKV